MFNFGLCMQLSYTPLLLSVSRLDDNAGDEGNK